MPLEDIDEEYLRALEADHDPEACEFCHRLGLYSELAPAPMYFCEGETNCLMRAPYDDGVLYMIDGGRVYADLASRVTEGLSKLGHIKAKDLAIEQGWLRNPKSDVGDALGRLAHAGNPKRKDTV